MGLPHPLKIIILFNIYVKGEITEEKQHTGLYSTNNCAQATIYTIKVTVVCYRKCQRVPSRFPSQLVIYAT